MPYYLIFLTHFGKERIYTDLSLYIRIFLILYRFFKFTTLREEIPGKANADGFLLHGLAPERIRMQGR